MSSFTILVPLWQRAREALDLMRMALGDPGAIMDLGRPSRREKREILAWLAPLEVLARKLLLIHASLLPKPRPKAKSVKGTRTFSAKKYVSPKPKVPKPRFVLFQRTRAPAPPRMQHLPRLDIFAARPPAPAPRPRRARLSPGVRLALRYQALSDVIAYPARAARRMARTLRAKTCAAALIAAAACPAGPGLIADDLRAAAPHAEIAAKRFMDSS